MPGALADLVDDAVLAVAAVLGVDVVVAGQPEEALLAAAVARGLGGGGGGGLGEDGAGGQSGAEQAGAAQQAPSGLLFGAQGLVGDGGVEGGGQGPGRLVVVRVCVVVMAVRVTVSVPHEPLLETAAVRGSEENRGRR